MALGQVQSYNTAPKQAKHSHLVGTLLDPGPEETTSTSPSWSEPRSLSDERFQMKDFRHAPVCFSSTDGSLLWITETSMNGDLHGPKEPTPEPSFQGAPKILLSKLNIQLKDPSFIREDEEPAAQHQRYGLLEHVSGNLQIHG